MNDFLFEFKTMCPDCGKVVVITTMPLDKKQTARMLKLHKREGKCESKVVEGH
jgi:hypothetical protein